MITAMHEESNPIVNKLDCTFQTINDYTVLNGNNSTGRPFDAIIKTFKDNGGIHVANLVGHEHVDMFGYTANGILNIAVECATTENGYSDSSRVKYTRTYDSFNVVSVDANIGIIKLIRIGNHLDHYLREKNVMCYDYINKRIISNQ